VYRFLVIPAANAYTWVIPDPVERCVANFFYNVKSPIYAVNHLLQFEFRATGRDIARFGVNTTVGVLGLFDPARSWLKIEREETHLENTLAKYGAGYGFYFVLPLLGPSDLRNAPSMLADRFLNPFTYILDTPTSLAVGTFDYFQDYAPSAEDYRILREKTDDPYIFYRNLYLQGVQRDADYEKAR
jgi:phospholipid-binding lipoprotein MlaA